MANTEDVQLAIAQFYVQYEDSYIDANTHGVIELLIKRFQNKGILPQGNLMELIDTLEVEEYEYEDDGDDV